MFGFTEQEQLIFRYVCKGYTNIEIGNKLNISKHTARAHVSSILRKLNVKRRIEVAYIAGLHAIELDID